MATVSPPPAPQRSNLLWIGGIWGLVAGVIALSITLIVLLIIGTISTYVSPGSGADEVIGYLFIGAWFACFIAIIPAVIGGTIIGAVLGVVAQQRRGASGGGWLGAAVGALLYVLALVIVFLTSGGTAEGLRDVAPLDWLILIIPAIPAALVFGGLSALLHRRAARVLR